MVGLNPARQAMIRTCPDCQGDAVTRILLTPSSNLHHRLTKWNLIKIKGIMVRFWLCQNCMWAEDQKTPWPAPPEPVRLEIVSAIRRLKKAGHRFFDWEKK